MRSPFFFAFAAALALAAPAYADDAPPPRRDYDAPAPDRDPLTFARAGANVALTNYVVWQIDWFRRNDPIYFVTRDSLGSNLRHGFAWDEDGLTTNLFSHPYHGGLTFAGARSAGLDYWESVPFPFFGSLMWELFSERQSPSANDLIVTSLGGIAIGEIFYRLSSLTLDDSKSGFSRLWREIFGGVISPVRGVDRAATGKAWADGAPPVEKFARIDLQLGIDRIRSETFNGAQRLSPSALFALEVEYGHLLPKPGAQTISAYDYFDMYAAGIVSATSPYQVSGAQLMTLGLLYGTSVDLSRDHDTERDNNVFGAVQSIDFQGADVLKFGAFGLGVADFIVLRRGRNKRLRLSADLQWVPLAGVSSPFTQFAGTNADRDYNFAMGGSFGLAARWDIGPFGQLTLRTRQYALSVVDGTNGQEIVGYARAMYEIDIWPDRIGVGIAPTLVYRAGPRASGGVFHATQLTNQLYVEVHP